MVLGSSCNMAKKPVIISLLCFIESFMVQTFKHGGFMPESFHYAYRNNKNFNEAVSVQSVDPNQGAWLGQHQKYSVICGKDAVKIVLHSGPLSEVKVLGMFTI